MIVLLFRREICETYVPILHYDLIFLYIQLSFENRPYFIGHTVYIVAFHITPLTISRTQYQLQAKQL